MKEVLRKKEKEIIKERRIEMEKKTIDGLSANLMHTFEYQFCIIAKATHIKPQQNIVYNQLLNLKRMLVNLGKMDIKCYYEIFNSRSELIFVIRVDDNIINHYVDRMDYTIFNLSRKYHSTFLETRSREFEPIKDYYSRNIILMIIMSEFNLYEYKKEGLVTNFFNLHEFSQLRMIMQSWKFGWKKCFTSPFSLKPSLEIMRFDSSMAMYYGCSIGLYFGFFTHYLSWLVFPALFGLAIYIATLFFDSNIFLMLILGNSIVTSMWVPFFISRWEQKEARLSYMWTTHFFDKEEPTRMEYNGYFVIDPLSKEVVQEAKVSAFKKRVSIEWFLFLLALVMIIGWFNIVTYLNIEVENLATKQKISPNLKIIANAGVTLLNVIVVKILNLVYLFTTRKIVGWENHMHQSAADNSLILKNFFFQFFNAYIYIVYYILVDQKEMTELRVTFMTTMVAYLFSQLVLVGIYDQKFLLPYATFMFCVRRFKKKWEKFEKGYYKPYFSARAIKEELEGRRCSYFSTGVGSSEKTKD